MRSLVFLTIHGNTLDKSESNSVFTFKPRFVKYSKSDPTSELFRV
jgi:hypothetical protein